MCFYLCVIGFDRPLDAWRVALLSTDTGASVMAVLAASWQEAREHINEQGLVHVAGHGWFIPKRRHENIRGPLGERMR